MRTLSSAWIAAMSSGAKPIYSVELTLGPIAYLNINNYLAVPGQSFSVYADGVLLRTVTEGVDFTVGASNATTATAIANTAGNFTHNVYAFSTGSQVVFADLTVPPSISNLTVSASPTAAWSATPGPIPQSVTFVSGGEPIEGCSASISMVEPLAMAIDPVTRAFSIGQVELTFNDDGALRTLLSRSFPRGRKLTMRLGCEGLSLSQFETLGKLVVVDYRPEPGAIIMECEEPTSLLSDAKVVWGWIAMHPYAVMIWLLDHSNIPAEFRDDTSLDSTTDLEVSHWAVSRSALLPRIYGRPELSSNGLGEPTSAKDLFDGLMTLVQGSYINNEDGTYSFRRYDATASVSRAWTRDDIDDVEYRTMTENVAVGVDVTGYEDGDPVARTELYTVTDDLSNTMHASLAFVDTSSFRRKIESDWLGGFGRLWLTIDKTTTAITVQHAVVAGFSGSRPDAVWQATSQRTEDTLTVDRVAYYLISDGNQVEIVKATASTTAFPNGGAYSVFRDDLAGAPVATEPDLGGAPVVNGFSNFTVERAQLNTTAKDWTYGFPVGNATPAIHDVRVFDVTLAVYCANGILSRFRMGAPIAKVRTSLRHLDLQLGDFVSFEDNNFVRFGADGADSTVVWEIVSKEVMALDDSPGIVFTLAWVRDDYIPAAIPVSAEPVAVTFPASFTDALTDDDGNIITDDNAEVVYRG